LSDPTPADFSATRSPTMSAMLMRALTSSTSACRIRAISALGGQSPRWAPAGRSRWGDRAAVAGAQAELAQIDGSDQTGVPFDREAVGETRDLVDDHALARGVGGCRGEVLRVQAVEVLGALPQRRREALEHPTLLLVEAAPAVDRHDERSDDALEHRHLGLDDARHDDASVIPGEDGGRVVLPGRRRRRACEATDEVGGQVLEPRQRRARPVEAGQPLGNPREAVQRVRELVAGESVAHPGLDGGQQRLVLPHVREPRGIQVAVEHGVLEVVHRVGDVIGEVHDLRLDAADATRRPCRIQRKTASSSG
jgi:hypothetical protein